MNERRFSRALRNVVRKFRDERERATVGRLNGDGTYTIQVPERPNFAYVTMESGTLTQALNRGRVPLRATLPVKLLRLHDGTLVIDGEDTDLLEDDTGGPDEYGVLPHPIGSHSDVAMTSEAAGNVLKYDGADWINSNSIPEAVGATIHAATAKTTPVDADTVPLIDSAASNALKKLSFANLATWVMSKITALTAKTTPVGSDSFVITDSEASDAPKRLTITNFGVYLATSLNALYGRLAVANTWLANNAFNSIATSGSALSVTRDLAAASTDAPVVSVVQDNAGDDQAAMRVQQDGTGSVVEFYDAGTLVARIADGGRLDIAQIIRALTSSGLRLEDDAGGLGIFIEDGGQVAIGPHGAADYAADVRTSNSTSQMHFANSNADSGGYVTSASANNFFFSGGVAFISGTGWVAKSTSAGIIGTQLGRIDFYTDTGLTPGGTFTPTQRAILDATGLGIGTTSPQGIIHAHDGTGGFMFVTKTAVGSTPVVVIPNASGDVTRALTTFGNAIGSSGTAFSLFHAALIPGASGTGNNGAESFRVRVNADGSIDVTRTAGSETYVVTMLCIWS